MSLPASIYLNMVVSNLIFTWKTTDCEFVVSDSSLIASCFFFEIRSPLKEMNFIKNTNKIARNINVFFFAIVEQLILLIMSNQFTCFYFNVGTLSVNHLKIGKFPLFQFYNTD